MSLGRLIPAARRRPAALVAAGLLLLLLTSAPLQAQFVPYYGKNKVKYDDFDWRVYKSPHFVVYYYPEFEPQLARLVSYAESSYQKVSSELKHEIQKPIPLILYKTHSEFEQTNLFPAFIPEGVAAFTEPVRDRMVIPIDEPPDRLQGLITHELTHVFEFDLIPRSLLQRSVPLWIDEGLADYMRGLWDPLDLMMVRDAAVADQVPRLSQVEFQPLSGRLVYNLGHACFEFIADRYGKEGLRQFLYTWRKNVGAGSLDAIYQAAFRIKPEEFDDAFEKWLRERFKPFRDKQRPSDYGKTLSPNETRTPFAQVFAAAPSPSGELVAALTANRGDQELDLVLLSGKDGSVVRNLTAGFTGAYQNITFPDEFTAARAIDFDPSGDRVGFIARVDKRRSLVLASALSGAIEKRLELGLDQLQSPCLLPNGRQALVVGLKDGVSDIYLVELENGETSNLTQDAYYDANPRVAPDGSLVVYTRRVSGNSKIFAFPLADPSRRTQLTFGPHDDEAPSFSKDGQTLYYSSNEDDDIFNLRSLDLRTGVVRQWTDVLGGNLVPFVLQGEKGTERLGFISYFKGDFVLKSLDLGEPLKEVEQDVRPAVEQLVDFQPDVTHQIVTQNKRRKGAYEGLFLEGRPPLNVGVTSSGDFFGGSQIALVDVLGDKNFTFTALSIREFRTYDAAFVNLGKRFQYGLNAFDTTRFFFYSPQTQLGFSREGALATQRLTGAVLFGQYPLDLYRRVELQTGAYNLRERIEDPLLRQLAEQQGLSVSLTDGWLLPVSLRLVQETTRFREFGPLSGSTFSVGVEYAAGIGSGGGERGLGRTTVDADLRKYLRVGSTSMVLAGRVRGFKSFGDTPAIFYFGGNMELRGYPYLSFAGNEGFFANAELRFPLIELAKTPLGLIGPLRGTLFAGVGAARFKGQPFRFSSSEAEVSYVNFDSNDPSTFFGEPVSGLHLVDGRASFGAGLQLFFLGYPLHFDWSKLTDLKATSKSRFDFWIGFDF